MTELLITAAFVLVPLLLLIPLLGKYIDIQHATIQAARYEAWEYSVWYASSGETPSGFTGDQPIKSTAQTQREARKRFFTRPDLALDSADDAAGYDPGAAAERNPLWVDHRGNRLWNGAVTPETRLVSSDATPDLTGGVMNFLLDVIDTVFEAIGEFIDTVASFFGGASTVSFDVINTDGFAHAEIGVPVDVPPGIVDIGTPIQGEFDEDTGVPARLVFSAQAAVLTDAWNAGGISHVQDRSGGIVPTRLLQELLDAIPGFAEVRNVIAMLIPEIAECDPPWAHPASYLPGAEFDPEGDGTLWLGYVNADAVPPDRLEVGGSVSCSNGLCAFDPEIERAPCGGVAP